MANARDDGMRSCAAFFFICSGGAKCHQHSRQLAAPQCEAFRRLIFLQAPEWGTRSQMQLDLRGKRCLIFGGNSGSGRCFELELASEDSTFMHTAA